MLLNEQELKEKFAKQANIDIFRIKLSPIFLWDDFRRSVIIDDNKIVSWNVGVPPWEYKAHQKYEINPNVFTRFVDILKLDGVI